ncbi:MAG: hypothetical protein NC829_01215 [Candidatus Omnitrophica bacterium]|nr:hypothetical protein [Candidatus Omnitrophota bacterium]
MNIHYAIASILTAVICISVGCLVLFKNKKSFVNKSYFLLMLSTAAWGIGIYFHAIINSSSWNLYWARFSHIGASFVPIFYLQFVLVFYGLYEKKKVIIKLGYILAIFFTMISFHPYFFTSVSPKITLKQWADPGYLYPFFISFFFSYILYALCIMLRGYKDLSGYRRNQVKYILIASILGFSGGSTTFLAVYGVYVPLVHPYALYLVAFYNIAIAYAILRYRLMDIRVAVTRAGIFAVVYILVLGLPFVAIKFLKPVLMPLWGAYWWMSILILGMALASAGPFIYMYIQRRATEYLLREERRTHALLIKASMGLTNIRELKRLLGVIVAFITKTLHTKNAAIYLLAKENDRINSFSLAQGFY